MMHHLIFVGMIMIKISWRLNRCNSHSLTAAAARLRRRSCHPGSCMQVMCICTCMEQQCNDCMSQTHQLSQNYLRIYLHLKGNSMQGVQRRHAALYGFKYTTPNDMLVNMVIWAHMGV